MKKLYLVLFCLVLSIFPNFSCKKEIIVFGTVVDSKTGLPVPNAGVSYTLAVGRQPDSINSIYRTEYCKTDAEGRFRFGPTDDNIRILTVNCIGYFSEQPFRVKCQEENTLRLVPIDGFLRLTIEHLPDSPIEQMYSCVLNKTFARLTPFIECYVDRYQIAPDSSTAWVLPLAADEMNYIGWTYEEIDQYITSPFSLPFQDSIYISRGDTADYVIRY